MTKTILITGASSGIGKACVSLLSKQNYNFILASRRVNILQQLVKKLKIENKTTILELDVSNLQNVEEKLKKIKNKTIDILINSAGLSLGKDSFENSDINDFETMINTNLKGLIYVTKTALPFLIKSKYPYIINIGSISGIYPYEGGNIYCASKAAVKSLSECMRIDLLKYGIKVTNIQPGAIETEFSLIRFKGDKEKAKKVYEGIKPLIADDIANIIQSCINLPPHVCINELTVTPTQQANSHYIFKK